MQQSTQGGRMVDRGGERQADARQGMAASRWVVQRRVTAEAGKDVAAYFTGNQDRPNVFILGRSGPIESREIRFPPGKFISRELTSLVWCISFLDLLQLPISDNLRCRGSTTCMASPKMSSFLH